MRVITLRGAITLAFILAGNLYAQRIDISNFNYRAFLDFGQNKGVFGLDSSADSNSGAGAGASAGVGASSGANPPIVNGKTSDFTFPSGIPIANFSAASNYGNLTHIGRGYAATANHVTSFSSIDKMREWGLTQYSVASEGGNYGADNKFVRFNKFVIEGEAGLLETTFTNTLENATKEQEAQNLAEFKKVLDSKLKDSSGNIYTFMTGSGGVELTDGLLTMTTLQQTDSGDRRGGSLGNLVGTIYINTQYCSNCSTSGIYFGYNPDSTFRNASTSGDSGSGIYAYDTTNKQWILLGVHSQGWGSGGYGAFVSNKDFEGFQSGFEQKISLTNAKYTMDNSGIKNSTETQFQGDKDIIFSSTQNSVEIEVGANIYRNVSGQAGGFVFSDSESSVTYKFTNQSGQNYFFNGSGLDIGKNVVVEWALRNQKDDSLHKIGQGTLKITTNYTPSATNGSENLGYLKIGEGKVILDTDKKAYSGIYITSGRGDIELIQGKAEAIGAVKNTADSSANGAGSSGNSSATNANSYTLAQDSANNGGMGIYFGTNGGGLDLKGNSLKLNTIAANDSSAIIVNSDTAQSTLTIEGLGYDNSGNKTSNKADTIIHASIGKISDSSASNATNIALKYEGNRATNGANGADSNASGANLVFDGNINIKGDLSANNANITLQGHTTTHATISNANDIEKIKKAHEEAGNPLPSYIDLSKPSNLNQPDWDTREFNINEIKLTNSALSIGRNAVVNANISADSGSKIVLGSGAKHFVDEKDGANINASGFGYYQSVVGGNLSEENKQTADMSSAYNGKITASGASIESSITHFNANLDLKESASLKASYLTLDSNSTIKLDNASATIENLHLQKVNDLNGKITLLSDASFKVEKSFIFEDSTFDLNALNSTNITKQSNYGVMGIGNSSITGTNTDISGNVALYDTSSLSVKNISFKDNYSASVFADKSASLTLSGVLSAENSNVSVALGGEKKFDIEAKNSGNITLDSIDESAKWSGKITASGNGKVESKMSEITASVELSDSASLVAGALKLDSTHSTISLKGSSTLSADTIIANALSALTLTLESSGKVSVKNFIFSGGNIASFSGSKLLGENISFTNSASLKATNALTIAQSVSLGANTTLESSGAINLESNAKIALDSNATLKASELKLTSANNATISAKSGAKLELEKLTLESSRLDFHLADASLSSTLKNINLQSQSTLFVDNFTLQAQNLTSDSTSRLLVGNFSFSQANSSNSATSKQINANTSILENLSLLGVGADSSAGENRYHALSFAQNLTLESGAKMQVSFDSSVFKGDSSGIETGKFYTLLSAKDLSDNRADKRIDFTFSDSSKAFYMVSKIENSTIKIKFLDDDPKSLNELNKHIAPSLSPLAQVLLEHNINDEVLDSAVKTDNYALLSEYLGAIDKNLQSLANSDSVWQWHIPMLTNSAINTRLAQLEYPPTPQYLANNTAILPLQRAKSDISSYQFLDDERNSGFWGSVGAGYVGGNGAKSALYATNLGYDYKFRGTDSLLGVMLGIGGSAGDSSTSAKQNMSIYTLALYTHNALNHNEIQANLMLSAASVRKTLRGAGLAGASALGVNLSDESATSTDGVANLNLYYKYDFIVGQSWDSSHHIKPVFALEAGYWRVGEKHSATYKQKSYQSTNLALGVGAEYGFRGDDALYSAQIIAKQPVYNSASSVQVSLANAQTYLRYDVAKPKTSFEIELIGAHKFTESFYVQYAFMGLLNLNDDYGIKASVKFGYTF